MEHPCHAAEIAPHDDEGESIGLEMFRMLLLDPGWDSAADRWSIELTGGASDLSVIEQ